MFIEKEEQLQLLQMVPLIMGVSYKGHMTLRRERPGLEGVGVGATRPVQPASAYRKKPHYRRQPPHFAGPLVARLNQELVLSCRVVQAGGEFWRVIEISHRCRAAVRGAGGDASIACLPGEELVRRLRPG